MIDFIRSLMVDVEVGGMPVLMSALASGPRSDHSPPPSTTINAKRLKMEASDGEFLSWVWGKGVGGKVRERVMGWVAVGGGGWGETGSLGERREGGQVKQMVSFVLARSLSVLFRMSCCVEMYVSQWSQPPSDPLWLELGDLCLAETKPQLSGRTLLGWLLYGNFEGVPRIMNRRTSTLGGSSFAQSVLISSRGRVACFLIRP